MLAFQVSAESTVYWCTVLSPGWQKWTTQTPGSSWWGSGVVTKSILSNRLDTAVISINFLHHMNQLLHYPSITSISSTSNFSQSLKKKKKIITKNSYLNWFAWNFVCRNVWNVKAKVWSITWLKIAECVLRCRVITSLMWLLSLAMVISPNFSQSPVCKYLFLLKSSNQWPLHRRNEQKYAHSQYVCVFAAFFLLSLLFLFTVLFYVYTVLRHVWVCNFPRLRLTFSVLLYAFWWWML